MISQVFPILSTPDLPRALAFYRDLLGGTVEFEFPDPDGQVVYAGLDLGESPDGNEVIIGQAAATSGHRPVDESIRQLQ